MPNLEHDPNADVVLLGEALADVFPHGAVLGGAPFNVARNLAALGQRPRLITRVGDDPYGAAIARQFEVFGLDRAGLQRDAVLPTGTVAVSFEGGSHRFHIPERQAWDALDPIRTLHLVTQARPAIVYFGTLAQRSEVSRQAIRVALSATAARRFLDLNLREGPANEALTRDSLGLADVVKVNDDELHRVLNWFVGPTDSDIARSPAALSGAVGALMQQFDLRALIVTRGAEGYAAFDADGRVLSGAGLPASVVDTVGAGDAFASVVLLGELRGWPLAETLARANAFAAAVCTLRGAVTEDPGFYAAWRARWGQPAAGALAPR
jgi:fructokinase